MNVLCLLYHAAASPLWRVALVAAILPALLGWRRPFLAAWFFVLYHDESQGYYFDALFGRPNLPREDARWRPRPDVLRSGSNVTARPADFEKE